MTEIGAYLQCYKNPYATYKCLESFRRFYPNNTIVLLSDNGYNYSCMAQQFGCIYIHSEDSVAMNYTKLNEKRELINSTNLVKRIRYAFSLIKEEYIMWLEDDVHINNKITDEFKYDINGYCPNKLETDILCKHYKQLDADKKYPFSGHGGSVLHKENVMSALSRNDLINEIVPNWLEYNLPTTIAQDYLFSLLVTLNGGTVGSYAGHGESCDNEIHPDIIVQHQYKYWYGKEMPSLIQSFPTKYGNISCYCNDAVFYSHLSQGEIYEEEIITNIIVPLLNQTTSEKFILDIGGHIGTHSILYSQLMNCKILTFEPQKKIFELLKTNIENNNITNCRIFNNAVGHKIMTTTLSDTLYDGYDCSIEYDTDKILNYGGIGLGENGEVVEMITIDSLNLPKCDYIKMDVEGAEILVLIGARDTIQKNRPFIWFESASKNVSDEMKKSMEIDFEIEDIFIYLSKLGYAFCRLNNENILAFHLSKPPLIERDLTNKEVTLYCESGEDGILFELFAEFGATNKFYVEFGAENGTQCNTRALKEYAGFHGVLFDMNFENPDIGLYKHAVSSENVVELFQQYNVPIEPDLLSVDIDSHDFYVLHEILKVYKPRIFVCEYNATYLPHEDMVVLKDDVIFNGNYFGASILSFYKLAKKYNYSLVYANEKGVNLFFVRNDVMQKSIFTIKNTNDIEKIYRTPKYGKGPNGGHEQDVYNQEYTSAESILR